MSEKQAQYGYKGKSMKETHATMEELSVDKCPDCNSEKIFKLKWIPYNEQTYRCKKCKLTWDKNTRYCNVCKDVAIYCKCYEDLP